MGVIKKKALEKKQNKAEVGGVSSGVVPSSYHPHPLAYQNGKTSIPSPLEG